MTSSIETDVEAACEAVGTWAEENFGEKQPAYFCLRGINEEKGELDTSVLKRAQGIDDSEKYADRVGDEAEKDAVADIFIYLMDYCWRANADVEYVESDMSEYDMTRESFEESAASSGYTLSMEAMYRIDDRISRLQNVDRIDMFNVEYDVAALIIELVSFCEMRGFDFDEIVAETMDDVLAVEVGNV